MKLDNKIKNVRTLIINTEYSIINCLPCDIKINFSNKENIIKKCTQFYININSNYQNNITFIINTDCGEFTSEPIKILSLKNNNEDNYIDFKNNRQCFKLQYYFKKNDEENILIIYAESILYNCSGIVFSINSKNKDFKLCFGVSKNIYLLSSKIEYKEVYIQLITGNYVSKKINVSELIEATPNLKVNMKSERGDILSFYIKKRFSYMNIINNPSFKENIMSIVFSILPSCRVINLLSTQKFFICDFNSKENFTIVNPLEKGSFHFFGRGENANLGISIINLNANKCTNLIKFKFNIGIYTLSTADFTFNLEIRKDPSEGCLDVYIIENTLDNSQILLENLSNEGISIYQKNFEKYIQILFPKEIQALKMFDYSSPDFTIETNNSVYNIRFENMEEIGRTIKLNKRIFAVIQANGMKMKITFYLIEEFNKLYSSSINNFYNLNIGTIFLSIIGDNESKDIKLINYQKNELLLIIISKFSITLNIESTIGFLNKDLIHSNIILNDLYIYNQKSEIGKFSCILHNTTRFLSFYDEIEFFKNIKIIKTKNQNFVMGNLELGIDPNFFIDLLDFFNNILYRMNITNFNIHEIFFNKGISNEEKAKLLINEYDQSRILISAKDFYFPEINFKFEITKYSLKSLLKERIGCSQFYYWLAKGLVGRKHSLHLARSNIPFDNGGIGYFFSSIFFKFETQLENQLTEIGLKGFFGQIKNLKNIFLIDDNNAEKNVQNNRYRIPRIFYGKFKYFQVYNKDDAYMINGFYTKYSYFKNKYYPIRIVKGNKVFFLFTTLAMFCVISNNFTISWNLDYFMIKSASSDKNEVIVIYNQTIDSNDSCKFNCENNEIAKEVANSLNEETLNNKESILEL